MAQNEEKKPVEQEEDFPSYSTSIEEVEKHYQTDIENGLTAEEAKKRLDKYGLNKLQEGKKVPFIIKLLKQFIEPMVIVLLVAAAISLGIFIFDTVTAESGSSPSTEWIDCVVILAIVIINALIGAIQEQKAEQSLEALKKLSTDQCTVK